MGNFRIGLADALVTCPVPAIGLYLKNLVFLPVYLSESN